MIDHNINNIWEILFNLLYVALSIAISLLYWYKDNNKGFKRIIVSAHSIYILLLLGLALIFGDYKGTYKLLLIPFNLLLISAAVSIILSFRYFTGSRWIHLAHLWNIPALIWTYFIGGMSLTGDWL